MQMFERIYRLAAHAAAMMVIVGGPAFGASLKVSSNGSDSATCGSGTNPPCATIVQAVTNASNGDSILVGPGAYGGTTINKAVRLWSSGGNGAAVIAGPTNLSVDGIMFGKKGKGFNVLSGPVTVAGNAVTVRGNFFSDASPGSPCVVASGADAVIRDNTFDNCSVGIQVDGATAEVRGNRLSYVGSAGILLSGSSTSAVVRDNRVDGPPSGPAFSIGGTGHLLWRNLAHGTNPGFLGNLNPTGVELRENLTVSCPSLSYDLSTGTGWLLTKNAAVAGGAPAFYLTAGTPFTLIGNVAILSGGDGFLLGGGSDHLLEDNTAIQNLGAGIYLGGVGTGVTVTGGNLYGNGGNCGLNNSSGSAVVTSGIYWGASTGPGADPADAICGNTVAVTVGTPAVKPAVIKMPRIK